MPCYQLRYLSVSNSAEIVEADDVEEAEDLARLRLLFRDPGFAIAVMFEGIELSRVTQAPKRAPARRRGAQSQSGIFNGQG